MNYDVLFIPPNNPDSYDDTTHAELKSLVNWCKTDKLVSHNLPSFQPANLFIIIPLVFSIKYSY